MGFEYLKQRTSGIFSNKALAFMLAKTLPREEFLTQMEDTWLLLFSQTTGSIDEVSELRKMRERIKKSGYQRAFDNAKITDEDLVNTFKRAVERSGRSLK